MYGINNETNKERKGQNDEYIRQLAKVEHSETHPKGIKLFDSINIHKAMKPNDMNETMVMLSVCQIECI